jgi:F420-dependent oxidoreductase-like protein
MQLGIDVAQHHLTWDELVRRTRFAENAGFDSAWVFDHFKPLYADPKGTCLEGWTLLAALAPLTRRIRLGALVTGVTYRHPSVLTAQAVTVDHVSNGRLELGIGAGWFEEEHRQLGIDFPSARERVARLDEALHVMRQLMTSEDVSFDGTYFRLSQATYRPLPIQRPHPPIWIGGTGEKLMLPLIGRQADVWHGDGEIEALVRKSGIVDEHARLAGRDPHAIKRSSWLSISEPWDQVLRQAEALRTAGFTYLVVSWPGQGQARVEEFVTRVMPELRR